MTPHAAVTVIGVPDDYRGEAPKAFIKLKPDTEATAEEVLEFLKPKLSKIEMPEQEEPFIPFAATMGAAFLHGAAVTIHKASG